MTSSKRVKRLIYRAAAFGVISVSLCSRSNGQTVPPAAVAQQSSQEGLISRRAVKGRGNIADPIRMTALLYDGKPIESTPFLTSDDWLAHLSITFRNASTKTLVAGSFQVAFPDLGTKYITLYYLRFGMIPEHQLQTKSGVAVSRPAGETPMTVAPGETVTIAFADYYPEIRAKLLSAVPLSRVTVCVIDYGTFWFSDGLRWSMNNYSREDSAAPGGYVPTPREALMPAQ